jgi:hypothetical protein
MKTVFIEATDATSFNWGKFMVGRMDADEWSRLSEMSKDWAAQKADEEEKQFRARLARTPLLFQIGFDPKAVYVFDLQTCEGSFFSPSHPAGATYDLDKHDLWVCPMFEPFLQWLYSQDLSDLDKLPKLVNLGEVPTAMRGYRRDGSGRAAKGERRDQK